MRRRRRGGGGSGGGGGGGTTFPLFAFVLDKAFNSMSMVLSGGAWKTTDSVATSPSVFDFLFYRK